MKGSFRPPIINYGSPPRQSGGFEAGKHPAVRYSAILSVLFVLATVMPGCNDIQTNPSLPKTVPVWEMYLFAPILVVVEASQMSRNFTVQLILNTVVLAGVYLGALRMLLAPMTASCRTEKSTGSFHFLDLTLLMPTGLIGADWIYGHGAFFLLGYYSQAAASAAQFVVLTWCTKLGKDVGRRGRDEYRWRE